MYIPRELLHIILEYDGKIKYKNGIYTNIIHKNDDRYRSMDIFIRKKIDIFQKIEVDKLRNRFLFYVEFDHFPNMGLVYDYNFTYLNRFEIRFYHFSVF
jgi:hypothetical protein